MQLCETQTRFATAHSISVAFAVWKSCDSINVSTGDFCWNAYQAVSCWRTYIGLTNFRTLWTLTKYTVILYIPLNVYLHCCIALRLSFMISNHKWLCLLWNIGIVAIQSVEINRKFHNCSMLLLAKISRATLIFQFLRRSMVRLDVYRILVDDLGRPLAVFSMLNKITDFSI